MQTIDLDQLSTITGGFARASAKQDSTTELALKDLAKAPPPPNNQLMPMMMMAMMSRR